MKILVNGNFITMNDSYVEAVVMDELIYYAGSMKEALKFDGEIVDLKGKTVIPGLIDLSTEFLTTSFLKAFVDVSKARSIEEVRYILENNFLNNNLIVAYGFDQSKFRDKEFPKASDIDYDIPILLIHANSSRGLINEAMMNLLEIKESYLEDEEFYKALFSIKGMEKRIYDSIFLTTSLYYQKGYSTFVARINSILEDLILKKANVANLLSLDTPNNHTHKRKIVRVDTDSKNLLIYSYDKLSKILSNYNDINKEVSLLVHSKKAIETVKKALDLFEFKGERWNLITQCVLSKEDIVYFTKKGILLTIDLDFDKYLVKTNYKPFDYLKELERNDVFYTFSTYNFITNFNIFDEFRKLLKQSGLYGYEYKERLYKLLLAVTSKKAYSLGIENEVGEIKEGLFSNLVVLNNNPLEDLEDIKVEMVFKQGKLIYVRE